MDKVLKCPSCGGQSVSYDTVKGAYHCEHCGGFFHLAEDEKTRGLFEEVTRLRNLMNFEDALEILEEEESIHPDNAEIYFAKILARYGVTYVDEEGKISPIPTLSRASELSVTTSYDYKKCLAKASNSVLKKSYEERLDEIETIRKRVIEASKKQEPYDVFICYKKTDGKLRTEDSEFARRIYDKLTHGAYGTSYRVFFADETLQGAAGQEYEPIIYNALMTAKVMIVIAASEPSYVSSPWVKNEWARYKALVDADKKDGKTTRALVPVLCRGFNPHDLPGALAKHQAIEFDDKFDGTLKATLSKFVKKGISSTIEKGKMVPIEIKPVEIEEKTIERRGFAKGDKMVVLSASESTKINMISNLLAGSDRDKFKRSIVFANEILTANPENGEAAWLKLLSIQRASTNEEMGQKQVDNLLENIELIVVALEHAVESDYKLRFDTLSKSLNTTIYSGNLETAAKFYSFLITVCDEGSAIDLTADCLQTLSSLIEDCKYGKAKKINLEPLVDALYPILTRIGVDAIIESYNLLANSFLSNKSYGPALTYYHKTLDLFAAQPEALWGTMLANAHINNDFEFAYVCKNTHILYDNIELMLKGGYVIQNEEDNYFIKARNICFYMLDTKSAKKRSKIISVYKELFSLIPERPEFATLAYECSVDFADLLTLKKEFKHAEQFYKDVLVKNPYDVRTHIGLLRCTFKASTNFSLLKMNKSFDSTNFGTTQVSNILEAEVQNGTSSGKYSWHVFSELHDKIKNYPKYRKRRLFKAIDNGDMVLEYAVFNPTIEYVIRQLDDTIINEITTNKHTENRLAESIYRWSLCPQDKIQDEGYIKVNVKSICHNTGFGDEVLGLNLKAELLLTLIPIGICWVLFAGSFINMDVIVVPMWSMVYPPIAAIATIILFFCALREEYEWPKALFGSAGISFGVLGAAFGIITGLGYGLQALSDSVFYSIQIFIPVAIALSILPYSIFKIVDIVQKRYWINKKYIITTILCAILVIVTPIIVSTLLTTII